MFLMGDSLSPAMTAGEDRMETPEDVAVMLRLAELGWGSKRIAAELGCSRTTVKRYLGQGGWTSYRGRGRPSALAGLEGWLAERFRRHRGNADVVRQELAREHGVRVSLRTVERAVADLRRDLLAEVRACVRFETPPGRQLQIDFGSTLVPIGGEGMRVYLFVATLCYSRRGLEAAFRHFGGVPREVLLDNAKPLVVRHDAVTREVVFNERLHAFARYWGFRPRACAPYRARTKGKDENGVGYVKKNAIAGHSFACWAALEAHLVWWMREVADQRIHGTTGEPPIERFRRQEAAALAPLMGRPPFRQVREVVRRVQADGSVDLDTNHYSVPWRLIGARVRVEVTAGVVCIFHAGTEVARHHERRGRRERVLDPAHLVGVIANGRDAPVTSVAAPAEAGELLRPLAEYEQIAGGGW